MSKVTTQKRPKQMYFPTYFAKMADRHGEDSGEQEHTVGDLQQLFEIAWSLMNAHQRNIFLSSTGVQHIVEGAVGQEEADKVLSNGRLLYPRMTC